MVSHIRINNGFITKLPGFYPGVTFEFSPNLTVLFGSNGSGKTSILKAIKAYCGIPLENGGWSRISSHLSLGAAGRNHFPWVYREYSPGHCECDVGWDGTPSFYNEGNSQIDKWAWFTSREISSEDGMTTEVEHMQNLIDNPSSGQYRLQKLNKLFNMLKTPPNLREYVSSHPAQVGEVDYIRSLPNTGRVSLLLDEPERALSIPKQLELFKLLEKMTKDYQIIIATHSPFILFETFPKIININEGYDVECKEIFKNCANTLNDEPKN